MPPTYQPMLAATLGRARGLDPALYRFEPKLDGWRVLVTVVDGAAVVRTRSGRDITRSVPELHGPPKRLLSRDGVLDGELVAGTGAASDFYRLGPRLARRNGGCPVTFVAFDLLWLDGRDLCADPYRVRRRLLESLKIDGGCWRTAESFSGDPVDLLIACDQLDIEGVVAKRLDGRYHPGKRSPDWIKVKTPSWRDKHAPRRQQR